MIKEKNTVFENPLYELLGTVVEDQGPLVRTHYYFRGWIPMTEFTNGLKPVYVHGHTGAETLISIEAVKPINTISVVENDHSHN